MTNSLYMAKKVIIKENMMNRLVVENILAESNVSDIVNNSEFKKKINDAVKDAVKNNRDVKKTVEKEVKKIIGDSLSEVFKTLWLRRSFWNNL